MGKTNLFSASGQMVNKLRPSLQPNNVTMTVWLRNWLKRTNNLLYFLVVFCTSFHCTAFRFHQFSHFSARITFWINPKLID